MTVLFFVEYRLQVEFLFVFSFIICFFFGLETLSGQGFVCLVSRYWDFSVWDVFGIREAQRIFICVISGFIGERLRQLVSYKLLLDVFFQGSGIQRGEEICLCFAWQGGVFGLRFCTIFSYSCSLGFGFFFSVFYFDWDILVSEVGGLGDFFLVFVCRVEGGLDYWSCFLFRYYFVIWLFIRYSFSVFSALVVSFRMRRGGFRIRVRVRVIRCFWLFDSWAFFFSVFAWRRYRSR